nr:MAG: hypothetical protein [Marsupenaeus japonicus pemonivirus]
MNTTTTGNGNENSNNLAAAVEMIRNEPVRFIGYLALWHATAWVTFKLSLTLLKAVEKWKRRSDNVDVAQDDHAANKGEVGDNRSMGGNTQDCIIYIMPSDDTERGVVTRNMKKGGNGVTRRVASHKKHQHKKCCQRSGDDDNFQDESEDASDSEVTPDTEMSRRIKTRSKAVETRRRYNKED